MQIYLILSLDVSICSISSSDLQNPELKFVIILYIPETNKNIMSK